MVTLLLLFFLLVIPYWAWEIKMRKNKAINKIPGPDPLPIVGNMFEFGSSIVDILSNMIRLVKEYGPVVRIWQGPFRLILMLSRAEELEPFLTSKTNITKSSGYNFFKPWLGEGLLTSTGDKWRKGRKLITPTFHFKILDQFFPIYHAQAQTLLTKLEEATHKTGEVDVYPLINLYALDVICETAMGITINAQDNPNLPYAKAVKGFLNIYMRRFFSVLKRNDFLFKFTSDYQAQVAYLKTLKEFTTNVLTQRKLERKQGIKREVVDEFGNKKRVAFLDLLLEQAEVNGALTDEEIHEQTDTFMFGGHDTLASAISFSLFEIAKHKDVQDRIVEEIQSVIGTEANSNISIQDLQNLEYLDRVTKETLRLYPAAPFVEREIEEDCKVGDLNVPKGTQVMFFIYALHRNEDVFPCPEVFDPDRFLFENSKDRHPFAYIPFSAGPRNCIGFRYAQNTLKTTLIYVLRHFELSPVQPIHVPKLGNDAVIKSLNGLPIKLTLRQ